MASQTDQKSDSERVIETIVQIGRADHACTSLTPQPHARLITFAQPPILGRLLWGLLWGLLLLGLLQRLAQLSWAHQLRRLLLWALELLWNLWELRLGNTTLD